MTYNGRAIMADAATTAGWTVETMSFQPDPAVEWVAYYNGTEVDVLIAWTPENTAPYVAIGGKQVRGMGALIEARRRIEAHA
jgi:hypothetical protein